MQDEQRIHNFLDVRMFHSRFGQPTDMPTPEGRGTEPPALMPAEQFEFRKKFLFEEFDEYSIGHNKGNLIKAADALFDLQYVTFGTILFLRAGHQYFQPKGWPSFGAVEQGAMGLGLLRGAPSRPRLLTQAMHEMMHESLGGALRLFALAHQSAEPNAVAFSLSALWNVSYAVYLAGALMGLPWEVCWNHVQRANMAKVRAQKDGSDSTRQSSWDVVKPIGWEAPDYLIAIELKEAGGDIPLEFIEEAKKTSLPRETGPKPA